MRSRLVTAVGVAALVMLCGPAAAVDVPLVGDCTAPPVPQSPTTGIEALLDPGPDTPRTGDPFAAHPTTTVYDVYGWAGAQWVDYDLGCGPDAARDPMGTVFGGLAAASMQGLKFVAALTTTILRWSWEPQKLTPALDPLGKVMSFAGAEVFQALFGLALALAGLILMWRAPRAQVRKAAGHAVSAAGVTVLVAMSLAWAATAGPVLDKALTGVISLAGDAAANVTPDTARAPASAGDRLAAAIDTSVVYQTWLAGTFGRTDSPVVDRHAPDLYRASALTRAEADALAEHPDRATDLVERKQDTFKTTAAKIKDEDPTSYRYLAGHENLSRLGYSALGWMALLAVAPLALLGGILMLVAVIAARLALWVIPLVGITAVIPGWHGPIRRLVETVIGMIGNATIFGSLALIWTYGVGWVLSPQTGAPAPVAVLVLLVAEAVLMTWCLHQVKKIAMPWTRIPHSPSRPARRGDVPPAAPRPLVDAAKTAATSAAVAAVTGAVAGEATRRVMTGTLRGKPYTGPSRMATTPPSFADSTDLAAPVQPVAPATGKVRVTVQTSDLPRKPTKTVPGEVSGPLSGPAAIGPGESVLGTDPDPVVYRPGQPPKTLTATPDDSGAYTIYTGQDGDLP